MRGIRRKNDGEKRTEQPPERSSPANRGHEPQKTKKKRACSTVMIGQASQRDSVN